MLIIYYLKLLSLEEQVKGANNYIYIYIKEKKERKINNNSRIVHVILHIIDI